MYTAEPYETDDAAKMSLTYRDPNSHLHVYIPSLPYAYIMRLINGTLVRLDDSKRGWEYFIAYKHEKRDELTYDFWLRNDVKFQDGTPLNADAVVENFNHFLQGAFTYTDIHRKLKSVEKLDEYRIRIHLNAPYGMLFHDLARINFYTKEYYRHHQWSKSITAENTALVGPFGAGPYILTQGYATGLAQSDTVVLKANPYYFEKSQPYIQTLTIHTRMPIDRVIDALSNKEGQIDIAFIPLNKKTEIVNSKYAKLYTLPSTTTLSFHMNLMNPQTPLHDLRIRQALNEALNQENLVKFAYKGEGVLSPFPISANMHATKALSQAYIQHPPARMSDEEIARILNGVHLKVVTQDRFVSICKGIEYQLKRFGVTLSYDITSDEKYVFKQLLTNREHRYDWDLLLWGNEDWYGHPWSSLFTLYTPNQWCAIDKDDTLDTYMKTLFTLENSDSRFLPLMDTILKHVYEKAYMLSIPSPNMVIGINKEVDFTPSSVAIMRLWEAKLTPYHWSIRSSPLPQERLRYRLPTKVLPDE
ncbi:putative two-component regulator, periplasmic binding protein [Sulfurospirillum multivorans]|nr:putative two-component regulator, periplasmic binding protein [Sulfurospirillum multivorans]